MKKKQSYGVLLCTMIILALSGCGDGSDEKDGASSTGISVVTGEPLLSESEREIINYELKYSKGEFVQEDYLALAGLYGETGLIRKQRDMLEESYRLYQDAGAFETLQTIAVNVAEEEKEILEQAQTMLQNLELSEYHAEAIHMLSGDTWKEAMMPKLYQGKRNYFMEQNGRTVLSMQAGYDEAGVFFANVWYCDAQQQSVYVKKEGGVLQFLTTALEDGAYNGAFEMWTIDSGSGSVVQEQGTFARGIFIGDYTVAVHAGTEGGDFFDLWNNREDMSYVTYTGNFDEEGKTTLEQPSEAKMKSLMGGAEGARGIVYAYGENGRDSLFVPLQEGVEAESYSFGAASMGLEEYPDFPVYEVQESERTSEGGMANAGAADDNGGNAADDNADNGDGANGAAVNGNEIQIRIYDGEVQYFNGKVWVNAGSVKSLSKEDPFYMYEQEKKVYLEERNQNSSGAQEAGSGQEGSKGDSGAASDNRFQTGTVPEDKPAAPSTNKPANQPKPENKPETSPAQPETPPAPPAGNDGGGNSGDGDSGGNSGGGNSGGSSGGGSNDGGSGGGNSGGDSGNSGSGGDAGGSDSGSTGGDVDIEWSPDIL